MLKDLPVKMQGCQWSGKPGKSAEIKEFAKTGKRHGKSGGSWEKCGHF